MFDQVDDAIRVTNDAIGLAEATRNVAMQAESFTLLGQIHAAQRETIRARDCYTRALQLNRDLGQTADQVTTLTALATLAADTGQFTQATQLFDQALHLSQSGNDRSTMAVLYGRMGSLAQKRGDMRTALGNYQRSVESAQSIGDSRLLGRALQYLATAQDVMGDPQAVTTYERAVSAADDAGDIRGGITMRLNMGMLIARLPERGAAEDAIGWLSDAANYAMEAGSEYDELRRRAEELIQGLGGGTNRTFPEIHRSNDGLDGSGMRPAPERDGDRYPDERFDARDERRRDDDDPHRDHQDLPTRSAGDRYDDDARYQDDDHRDSGPFDAYESDRRSPVSVTDRYLDDDDAGDYAPDRRDDRDPYGGPDDRTDPRYAGAGRNGRHHDTQPSYAERDDYRADDQSPSRYDEDDQRYRFDDDQEEHRRRAPERGRDSYYDDDRDPREARESIRGRHMPDEPARWVADRDDRHDEGYDDGYGRPVRADDRNGYREPGYADDRESYRARGGSGGDADDDPRGWSRREASDALYGASSAGFGADRYDEDTEPGYDGYQDNNPEYYPPQRSGRTERTSRRESGRRVSPGRGLDDEPSDPGPSTSSRRRSGFGNLFRSTSNARHATDRPEDHDRSLTTLSYDGRDESSPPGPG